MPHCKHLDLCPVWKRFQSTIKEVWIKNYCKGDKQERCVRKTLLIQRQEVPLNLLPNGTSLE